MKTKKPVRWEKVHRLPDAEWKNLIAGAAWESVAILLLLFAALFTLFQLAGHMSLYKVHVLVLVVGITGVVFLREAVLQKLLSLVQDKKWAVLCRIAVSALLTFVIGWNLWRYGKAHYIELKSGYHAFLKNFYVDYFLTFQKSVIISGVDEDELSAFLCFAVLCVFTVLFALSPIGRRKYLFLGVPIGAIALVMYVGKAPSWKGICLMAAGALLIHRSWRRKGYYISNAIVIAVMMGLILLVGAVMNPSAKQVLARSKEVKAFEAKLEARITQFFSGVPATGGKDTVVTNQPPRYRDEKILTIRLDHAPEGNLYLQETSGRSYDKGRWSVPETEFIDFCADYGIRETMATEALSNSLYRCFSKKAYESAMQDRQINASLWKNVEVIGYELEYKKKNAGSMLLPYGANAAGIADVIYTGSTIPQKRAGLKKVKLEAWNTNEFNGNAFLYGKQAAINERSEEEKQFWNLYDEYVHQHYLSYPEFLKKTKNYDYYVSMMGSSFPYVGQSVSSSELVDMGYSIKGLDGLPIKLNAEELSQIIYVSALPPNVDRIDVAEQLAWTMTSGNSTYSWNLDRLKDGEDPVEHFLNNTRKGYCTHYASAAALLLRSIGVPTRYVTGYIVNADSFEQKKDGSYEAKVIDRNDHAWIEIYLDGIGWIPYEVTPGYDSESKELPTSKEQEQARREAESTPEPQEESSEATPEPVVTATPGPTKEPTISVTPEPKKEKSKQKEEGGKSAKDGGSEKEQAKWPIFVCIGAVLIVGVVSTVLLRKRAAARKLERALRSRYYKAAVVIMNRRIYRKLRRSGRIKKDCRSDAEFEAALRTAFNAENQEWISQYMRVAKAAAFSGGSLSKEDCQFVQKVYQMVK